MDEWVVHGASEWCKSMVQVNGIGIDIDIDIDIGIGNDIWCKYGARMTQVNGASEWRK